MARDLSRDNDYLIERVMTIRRESDGEEVPATGLVGGIGYIALDDGEDAAHASLQVNLTERSGVPGTYFGVLQGSDIDIQIDALPLTDGQLVWECVQFGTDYRAYFKVKVRVDRKT
jgi:hypothetical protein